MKHARRRLVGLLRKQSMGDLMGCQVSNIWKDNFAYDKERVDVSLELKPVKIAVHWACAMPGWALPSWQFEMFSAGVWPGQSCGQGPSLCCPCSVPPGCCPGAVMEEKQSWTGGHRPSVVSLAPVPTVTRWNLPLAISGHGVRPYSFLISLPILIPAVCSWITLSVSVPSHQTCLGTESWPVACICCAAGACWFHALISSCPWVGAVGVLVDTVTMLYPSLFFYIWFIFAWLEGVFFYFLISYLCRKSQNVWSLHCRIKWPITLLARNKE